MLIGTSDKQFEHFGYSRSFKITTVVIASEHLWERIYWGTTSTIAATKGLQQHHQQQQQHRQNNTSSTSSSSSRSTNIKTATAVGARSQINTRGPHNSRGWNWLMIQSCYGINNGIKLETPTIFGLHWSGDIRGGNNRKKYDTTNHTKIWEFGDQIKTN